MGNQQRKSSSLPLSENASQDSAPKHQPIPEVFTSEESDTTLKAKSRRRTGSNLSLTTSRNRSSFGEPMCSDLNDHLNTVSSDFTEEQRKTEKLIDIVEVLEEPEPDIENSCSASEKRKSKVLYVTCDVPQNLEHETDLTLTSNDVLDTLFKQQNLVENPDSENNRLYTVTSLPSEFDRNFLKEASQEADSGHKNKHNERGKSSGGSMHSEQCRAPNITRLSCLLESQGSEVKLAEAVPSTHYYAKKRCSFKVVAVDRPQSMGNEASAQSAQGKSNTQLPTDQQTNNTKEMLLAGDFSSSMTMSSSVDVSENKTGTSENEEVNIVPAKVDTDMQLNSEVKTSGDALPDIEVLKCIEAMLKDISEKLDLALDDATKREKQNLQILSSCKSECSNVTDKVVKLSNKKERYCDLPSPSLDKQASELSLSIINSAYHKLTDIEKNSVQIVVHGPDQETVSEVNFPLKMEDTVMDEQELKSSDNVVKHIEASGDSAVLSENAASSKQETISDACDNETNAPTTIPPCISDALKNVELNNAQEEEGSEPSTKALPPDYQDEENQSMASYQSSTCISKDLEQTNQSKTTESNASEMPDDTVNDTVPTEITSSTNLDLSHESENVVAVDEYSDNSLESDATSEDGAEFKLDDDLGLSDEDLEAVMSPDEETPILFSDNVSTESKNDSVDKAPAVETAMKTLTNIEPTARETEEIASGLVSDPVSLQLCEDNQTEKDKESVLVSDLADETSHETDLVDSELVSNLKGDESTSQGSHGNNLDEEASTTINQNVNEAIIIDQLQSYPDNNEPKREELVSSEKQDSDEKATEKCTSNIASGTSDVDPDLKIEIVPENLSKAIESEDIPVNTKVFDQVSEQSSEDTGKENDLSKSPSCKAEDSELSDTPGSESSENDEFLSQNFSADEVCEKETIAVSPDSNFTKTSDHSFESNISNKLDVVTELEAQTVIGVQPDTTVNENIPSEEVIDTETFDNAFVEEDKDNKFRTEPDLSGKDTDVGLTSNLSRENAQASETSDEDEVTSEETENSEEGDEFELDDISFDEAVTAEDEEDRETASEDESPNNLENAEDSEEEKTTDRKEECKKSDSEPIEIEGTENANTTKQEVTLASDDSMIMTEDPKHTGLPEMECEGTSDDLDKEEKQRSTNDNTNDISEADDGLSESECMSTHGSDGKPPDQTSLSIETGQKESFDASSTGNNVVSTGPSESLAEKVVESDEAKEDRILKEMSQRAEDRKDNLVSKGAQVFKNRETEANQKGLWSTKATSVASSGSYGSQSYTPGTSRNEVFTDGGDLDKSSMSVNELKSAMNETEEKYRRAMLQIAQLDNERTQLCYQTQQLQDLMEEQEEELYRVKKAYKKSCQEVEHEKQINYNLQRKIGDLQESLRQRDELIQEQGLVLIGEKSESSYSSEPVALVSPEIAKLLEETGEGPLDVRLKNLVDEKRNLEDQVRRLHEELEAERYQRSYAEQHSSDAMENGLSEMQLLEVQREANRQVNEYRLKLQKAEQDLTAYHGNISRLENQLQRFKQTSEFYEKNEDEMRAEKRKLMRDLRTALDRIEEMEMTNSHLEKRLERIRASRTAISSQS